MRSGADDGATPVRDHHPSGMFATEEYTGQVHPHQLPPGQLVLDEMLADASVVDHDVKPAELRHGLVDNIGHGCLVTNIGANEQCLVAVGLQVVGERVARCRV